jgi:hypothetical protein
LAEKQKDSRVLSLVPYPYDLKENQHTAGERGKKYRGNNPGLRPRNTVISPMAAVKYKIYVEILSPLPLTTREEGERVLHLWETLLPNYLPDKIGNWEPIDNEFNISNRNTFLNFWQWGFFAVKKNPRMEASIWMRKAGTHQHAIWVLCFDYGGTDIGEIVRFVKAASQELEADFGCLTLLTESEIEIGMKNGTVMNLDKKATRFSFFIASQDIQKAIPDLYWMTVFGAPYVKMFGEKLLSAPTHKTEVLNNTMVSLQLTSNLDDVKNNVATFAESKRRVKLFLGEKAFFNTEQDNETQVPHFIWK